ncbi:hypothetical protein ABZ388_28085 [Micromonospora parva]|uniref:hypothetical protein n=1 Tax=Micromonospora parva TaxID=1464048 RepID=UPI0033C02BFA
MLGSVLRPGDLVHDALKGRPLPRQRKPVGYYDTADLDVPSTAERARIAHREPVTMVVTWNPAKWNPDGTWAEQRYPQQVEAVADGGLLRGRWATVTRTSGVEPGDRVFLLRQGGEPRGVIGSGTTSRIFSDGHWDDDRADGMPEDGLPHEMLIDRAALGCPDLTTFCRLDELGLVVVGQRLKPDRPQGRPRPRPARKRVTRPMRSVDGDHRTLGGVGINPSTATISSDLFGGGFPVRSVGGAAAGAAGPRMRSTAAGSKRFDGPAGCPDHHRPEDQ